MKVSFFILIICFFFSVLSGVGCSGSSGKDNPPPDEIPYEIEAVIGPDGGLVEITSPESDLQHIRIEIPEGALEEGKRITISSPVLPADLPLNYIAAGSVVEFGPEGTRFNLPVDIYLTYKDSDNDGIVDGTYLSELNVGILYYNTSTGAWEKVELKDMDAENNIVSAGVEHFSIYLVFMIFS